MSRKEKDFNILTNGDFSKHKSNKTILIEQNSLIK